MNGKYKEIIPIKRILIDEGIFGEFNRFDLVVRYMAIEEFYKERDNGIEIYKKMQRLRIAEKIFFGIETGSGWEQFEKLIAKFEDKEYNYRYPVRMNRFLRLINGAHRISLAMYKKMEYVSYKYSDNPNEYNEICDYSIRWFEKNYFTNAEMDEIINKFNIIKNSCFEEIYAIIWEPAIKEKNEIINDIKKELKPVNIENKRVCFTSSEEYQKFIRKIYEIDNRISEEKLNSKIKGIIKENGKNRIIMLKISLNNITGEMYQNYYMNPNYTFFQIVELKNKVREHIKKDISSYIFDNVFHCAVNRKENLYLEAIYESLCYDEKGLVSKGGERTAGCVL